MDVNNFIRFTLFIICMNWQALSAVGNHPSDVCRIDRGETCQHGCYGDLCDRKCSQGGKKCYSSCDKDNGRCEQCQPGFHGEDCNKACNTHCHKGRDNHRHCNRTDGRCLDNCKHGWHGSHCNIPCSENCLRQECYNPDGWCTEGCNYGWHGSHCNTPCSDNCIHKNCSNPEGRCTFGCKDGWYGSHCHSLCSSHCKLRQCNHHNGKCTHGCEKGYYGKHCDKECDKNCKECKQNTGHCLTCLKGFWSVNCSQTCSMNCNMDICDINGHCTRGCKNTHHGHQCLNRCGGNCKTCDQFTGNCTKITDSYDANSVTLERKSGSFRLIPNFIHVFGCLWLAAMSVL